MANIEHPHKKDILCEGGSKLVGLSDLVMGSME